MDRAKSNTFTPDLTYLRKGPPTSFARRLANAENPLFRSPKEPSPKPNASATIRTHDPKHKQPNSKISAAPLTLREKAARKLRLDELTAQRKAARLARESRESYDRLLYNRASPEEQQWILEQGNSPPKPLPPNANQSGPGRRDGRSAGKSTRGAPRGRGGLVRTGSRVTPRASQLADQDPADTSRDITLEILEQGGDEKAPAQFTTAEKPFADLHALFGPSPATNLEVSTLRQTPSFSLGGAQWIRETYGGDYSRRAPQTGEDFLVSHRNLGPLKHAALVIGKQADITMSARKQALDIVASLVGEGSTQVARRV